LLAGAVAAGLSVPALSAASAAEDATHDPAATKALYSQLYDQLQDGTVNRGHALQLGDREATVCMMGNGYGIHGLAVGPNTRCEFAGEVFAELIAGSTPEDNARDRTPTTEHARSPVTEMDYDMECVTGQDDLITCPGGIGAEVYLFSAALGGCKGVDVKPRLELLGARGAQRLKFFHNKCAFVRGSLTFPKPYDLPTGDNRLPKDPVISRN